MCGQGGLSGILSIGENYLASNPKSLSALSLFVKSGNSEESLSSVSSAATLALLCFPIDPRQSDIHTTLGFQQNSFPSSIKDLVIFSFQGWRTYPEDDKLIPILMLIKVWKSLKWSHNTGEGDVEDEFSCQNMVDEEGILDLVSEWTILSLEPGANMLVLMLLLN